jgi:IS30 family transposase
MHRSGISHRGIATKLGRDNSTISRELLHNGSRNSYWAVAADRKARQRRRERPWASKLDRTEARRYVQQGLRKYWSSDQIAGRSRSGFPHDRRRDISHPTIYAWIAAETAAGKQWQRYLRRLERKRPEQDNHGRLRRGASIEERPAVIDRRKRYGDWEGDTIVWA